MAEPERSPNPVRTCLGCRTKRPKSLLVRLAADDAGRVVWDKDKVKPGRGAYICPSRECLAKALKSGKFGRAFRRTVSVDILETAEVPWED